MGYYGMRYTPSMYVITRRVEYGIVPILTADTEQRRQVYANIDRD
jgi:hypothetical protein